jgi:cysteinyl-tRNA synthetase
MARHFGAQEGRACMRRLGWLALVAVCVVAGCGGTRTSPDAALASDVPARRGALFAQLKQVRTWAYQIQALENRARREALEASAYDLFVLEPTRTVKGSQSFDTRGMVSRLKNAGNRRRLVIAYVDIGEAERFRTYWQDWWQAPTRTSAGVPNFLLALDPDGWSGCFPCAYWDARWQRIIATGSGSVLDKVLDDGFDGIYLDWVEGYDDPSVRARAKKDGVNPKGEMIRFIRTIRETAQARNPDFLVIAQNAPGLIENRPGYANVIDGMAQEDLHFSGAADVGWLNPRSGDVPTPAADQQWLEERLDLYLAAGLPVFVVDYCVNEDNRLNSYRLSRERGYIPFVSRTPLDRLPAPPP